MSKTKTYTRKRNLFDPASKTPFRLSRSKLENFIQCPRCFYLDRRLGVAQPSLPAFTLNSAVDALLKVEFDSYRLQQKPHPFMTQSGLSLIPYAHPELESWRHNFKGIRHHHQASNFMLFGAIDDIWVDQKGQLFIVDYKATSTNAEITLDSEYRQAYKRQMEIYQWLFRQNRFSVSSTGYFVYCNAVKDYGYFDKKLNFKLHLIEYRGHDHWVEQSLLDARECLSDDQLPSYGEDCEYCRYRRGADQFEAQKNSETSSGNEKQGELF